MDQIPIASSIGEMEADSAGLKPYASMSASRTCVARETINNGVISAIIFVGGNNERGKVAANTFPNVSAIFLSKPCWLDQ
jgi:hypothetical protein